ncbi:hypothetical protein LTR91_002254 [Friedmanniomyces endolithicus]|uniref:Uncharacterized protein n=1 Tax=Friedmanniomyces endolithicus TaxID=329885 RepID=A0A4U0UMJ7_9PEZI|nr:hypothetical protein LTS09_001624 [Friedmanniomyces endolithicus]KAK0268935.1 hypothetical protein LTR35_015204 [Friedmanniomyces endolithicus]KAK0277669.1 hypothetical protein LTS00_014020 [Friedmanniomyces endolithicus]KAK0308306.1 hypothetical protein LTR01_004933 [Friedmanniomyces endolithicus]KAK0318247.1 hypothetical protein LTR82_010635 [Friedmanniomyces endolithicus]
MSYQNRRDVLDPVTQRLAIAVRILHSLETRKAALAATGLNRFAVDYDGLTAYQRIDDTMDAYLAGHVGGMPLSGEVRGALSLTQSKGLGGTLGAATKIQLALGIAVEAAFILGAVQSQLADALQALIRTFRW